eukprot:SAG11_NODE_1837_length_4187_cov_4.303082_3_plen_105_part_00
MYFQTPQRARGRPGRASGYRYAGIPGPGDAEPDLQAQRHEATEEVIISPIASAYPFPLCGTPSIVPCPMGDAQSCENGMVPMNLFSLRTLLFGPCELSRCMRIW